MKRKIISIFAVLSITGCSIPVINTSHDFKELEKEYKSFSTKALSDAYVKRMFGRYLSPVNSVQLTRQLEFSRYLKLQGDTSYETSLKSIFAATPSLYDTMTGTSATDITQKMSTESATFGTYVEGLSPYPATPVATGATNITSSSFTANWNPVSGATGYKLYLNETEVYSGTNTSFNLTGLTSGSTYSYYIKSVNNAGESLNSNTINVTLYLNETINYALSATSVWANDTYSPYAPSRAIDNNTNSYWASSSSSNNWIAMNLGSQKYIHKVRLMTNDNSSYRIQVSNNNSNYTTVASGNVNGATWGSSTFTPGLYQYVRVYFPSSVGWITAREIQVY